MRFAITPIVSLPLLNDDGAMRSTGESHTISRKETARRLAVTRSEMIATNTVQNPVIIGEIRRIWNCFITVSSGQILIGLENGRESSLRIYFIRQG